WDASKSEPLTSRTILGGRFGQLSPDGRSLVCWTPGRLLLEDVASGRERVTIPGEFGRFMAFSREGKFLAIAALKPPGQPPQPHVPVDPADDGRVEAASIIEVATGKEVLRIPTGWFAHVEFAPDARMLAMDGNGPFRLWDAVTGERVLEKSWPKEVIDSPW